MKSLILNKKAIAWSLYDFADTAFSALFITFFFPILIKVHLGGNEWHIGLAMSVSVLLAALCVPLIGAVSDASGRRMPILFVTALLTAFFTVIVGFVGLVPALVFGLLANITHLISKNVYDAKMIEIVPREQFGRLSGLGVGVGYFGTIASLAVGAVLLSYFGWETIEGIRAMFFEASAFYVIFFLPLFFLVPDRVRESRLAVGDAIATGLSELKKTIKTLPQTPVLAKFLLASFFYNNGMNTVIIFLALYGREVVGLGVQEFFPVYALMALTSAAGSFLFGSLSDRIGVVFSIELALSVWIGVIVYLLFLSSYFSFLVVGMVGGAVLGAIWTLNRHMMALISPERKIAELFGIQGLTERFSGVLGPLVFGYLAAFYGYGAALFSVLLFFLIGFGFMMKIDQRDV